MRLTTSIAVLLSTCLGACDRVPTIVHNESTHEISVQTFEPGYGYWSGSFRIKAESVSTLALNEYFGDVTGIKVAEDNKVYSLTPDQLDHLKDGCPRSQFDRIITGGYCYITYSGYGRFSASRSPPSGFPQ
jgi:hypothetical protein